MTQADVERWAQELAEVMGRIGARFGPVLAVAGGRDDEGILAIKVTRAGDTQHTGHKPTPAEGATMNHRVRSPRPPRPTRAGP
jgi:hypothetical protein